MLVEDSLAPQAKRERNGLRTRPRGSPAGSVLISRSSLPAICQITWYQTNELKLSLNTEYVSKYQLVWYLQSIGNLPTNKYGQGIRSQSVLPSRRKPNLCHLSRLPLRNRCSAKKGKANLTPSSPPRNQNFHICIHQTEIYEKWICFHFDHVLIWIWETLHNKRVYKVEF